MTTICHATKRGPTERTHGDKSHKHPKLPCFRYLSFLQYISLRCYILSKRRMFSIVLHTESQRLVSVNSSPNNSFGYFVPRTLPLIKQHLHLLETSLFFFVSDHHDETLCSSTHLNEMKWRMPLLFSRLCLSHNALTEAVSVRGNMRLFRFDMINHAALSVNDREQGKSMGLIWIR